MNLPTEQGNTPLYLACTSKISYRSETVFCAPLVRWLCENGAVASINVRNNEGETPLFAALRSIRSDVHICDVLLEYGAHEAVSTHPDWQQGGINPTSMVWTLENFGPELSDESLGLGFNTASRWWGGMRSEENPNLVRIMLLVIGLGRPRAIFSKVPNAAPGEVALAAARAGVDIKLFADHPQAVPMLSEALAQRWVFVDAFLFGCRQSSGSTFLWLIGSKYAMAGLRKAVAEYAGVVWRGDEAGRIREAHRVLSAVAMTTNDDAAAATTTASTTATATVMAPATTGHHGTGTSTNARRARWRWF